MPEWVAFNTDALGSVEQEYRLVSWSTFTTAHLHSLEKSRGQLLYLLHGYVTDNAEQKKLWYRTNVKTSLNLR